MSARITGWTKAKCRTCGGAPRMHFRLYEGAWHCGTHERFLLNGGSR